jgi:hypothetical protein
MDKIADILNAAKTKSLTIEICRKILTGSEGKKGGAHTPGHPLQHVASDNGGDLRVLKSDYHKRGPGKLSHGKIVTNKGQNFHSQFKDLGQAAAYLKTILESKAGVNALGLLSATDWEIYLRYGVANGDEYYERTMQLLSEVKTNENFVLLLDKSMRSVELILHHKSGDELHVQSMYPSNRTFPPGVGEVQVRPNDDVNPSPHHYCVMP